MRKTELNEIIREKICNLEDSDSMKDFLIEIIDIERQNVVYSKPQYTKDYIDFATKLSKKEEM
ncbi:MAG: hypothetical protein MIO93_08830 [ANME-2 cluster archaeon]|jgi:hypothetical protein|nr:hypothetical protein [ANME-2 cluster archaeon]